MKIALAQFNPVVGDLSANAAKIREIYSRAVEQQVELLILPELAVCGYPPEDLLYKNHFVEDNRLELESLAADCRDLTMIVGFAEGRDDMIYNSAAVLQDGAVGQIYRKALLPNYGVFDERRYFHPGSEPLVANVKGIGVAITICEDIWSPVWLLDYLKNAPDFQILANISASPFHTGKFGLRAEMIRKYATDFNAAVCYCNLVGGQDEIVFDGRSIIFDSKGKIQAQGKAFEQDMIIADVLSEDSGVKVVSQHPTPTLPGDEIDEIYQALILGTRDYTAKNNFKKALVGLSGGIDSSVVACIAVAAMGAENVTGITMPSKFSSADTKTDARKLAENLGIDFMELPIQSIVDDFDGCLQSVAGWDNTSIAYENLQARVRGTMLMTLSNQFGAIVLVSSNKSETAVGYSTLYGDTAGGFSVIKDVAKTVVYKLADRINQLARTEIIPASVITRPPTAELRDDQKDSDSLPEYELLDAILKGYIEQDKSAQELVAQGLPADDVLRVIKMVDMNEYKRRQCPPGIKITAKAFGRDRRLPITNHYRPKI